MKRLKKMIRCIFAMAVLIVAVITLASCGSKDTAVEDPLVGSWTLSEIQAGDKSYTLEELAAAVHSDKAGEVTILLDIDGEGRFALYAGDAKEPVAEGQYSVAEESGEEAGGYLFTVDDGKQHVSATLEEDKLVLHDTVSAVETKMIFVKEQGGE